MKSLEQVAKTYKKAIGKAIYPGVPYPQYQKTGRSRAFDTGNLLTQIVRQEVKAKKDDSMGVVFTIDVGPPKAKYGTYVHYGTYKMQARPFADIATDDENFIEAFNSYMDENIEDFAERQIGLVFTEFTKSGFSVK